MYAFVAMPPRTLVLANAYADALVRSLTSSAGAPTAVQSASSPETKGTTIDVIDPNERALVDPNDRYDINPNI